MTRGAQVHDGNVQATKLVCDLVGFDTGNDSIATPVLQPVWRDRTAFLFGQEN